MSGLILRTILKTLEKLNTEKGHILVPMLVVPAVVAVVVVAVDVDEAVVVGAAVVSVVVGDPENSIIYIVYII